MQLTDANFLGDIKSDKETPKEEKVLSQADTNFLEEFDTVSIVTVDKDDTTVKSDTAVINKNSEDKIEEQELEKKLIEQPLEELEFDADAIEKKKETSETSQQVNSTADESTQLSELSTYEKLCSTAAILDDKAEDAFSRVKQKASILANSALAVFNNNKNLKVFENGKLVICGDFEFLLHKDELMLLKYTGMSSRVICPDEVGGKPVRYIHSNAFKIGHFNGTNKIKAVFRVLKNEDILLHDVDSLKYAAMQITYLQLPVGLQFIPNDLFRFCPGLYSIEIPQSVVSIAPAAFNNSKLNTIFFSNNCVKNMKFVKFQENTRLFVKKNVVRSYRVVS